MKIINSKIHGVIDYAFDVLFMAAPTLFGLSPTATAICYVVALGHFLTSLCTQYELSLFKLIPFPVHGGLELVASIAFVAMPWIAGIGEEVAARNFFIAAGAVLFGVWLTTDYEHARTAVVTGYKDDEITWRKTG